MSEKNYLNLLKQILYSGDSKTDRTGVGTKSIFGTQLRFDLTDNKIPIITTKKMYMKGIIEELLFFIRGETNTKLLEEKNVNIWKGNTSREFLDKRGLTYLPEGDMGLGYGWQWRKFNGEKEGLFDRTTTYLDPGVDQLKEVINTLKTNPDDRRMIVSAWNPSQLSQMALPPCHILFQLYVNNGNLSLQWYQRSVDSFLGLPFNIISYSILCRILAEATGLKAKEVIFSGGDTHIYNNHFEQVKEQLMHVPYEPPTMTMKPVSSLQDIEKLKFEDFTIHNYQYDPAIKAEMAI